MKRLLTVGYGAVSYVIFLAAFHVGSGIVGFALGVPLISVAALASTTHICIPTLIYNRVLSQHARTVAAEAISQ